MVELVLVSPVRVLGSISTTAAAAKSAEMKMAIHRPALAADLMRTQEALRRIVGGS